MFDDILCITRLILFQSLRHAKLTDNCNEARRPENKQKNRYRNVLPCKYMKRYLLFIVCVVLIVCVVFVVFVVCILSILSILSILNNTLFILYCHCFCLSFLPQQMTLLGFS